MNLTGFSIKDILETAIKSEVEAKAMYLALAGSTKDAFLADRLKFIAGEEMKHKIYLEGLYKLTTGREDPELPESSIVPLPEVKIEKGMVMASELISQAMTAEIAASDFYLAMAEMIGDQENERTLRYLSNMEMGHHNLLSVERDRLLEQEDYEFEWPMMHAGP